jgi:hypothetical protein
LGDGLQLLLGFTLLFLVLSSPGMQLRIQGFTLVDFSKVIDGFVDGFVAAFFVAFFATIFTAFLVTFFVVFAIALPSFAR